MMEYQNRIIDFFVGNEMHLGIVAASGKGRVQVTGATGRTQKVAEKSIVAIHGQGTSPADLESTLEAIQAAMDEIDSELLWQELVESEEKAEGFALFSEIYFGDTSPVHLSAIARVVAEDPVHFKRSGLGFFVRTPEEAEEVALLRRRRAEKAAQREAMSTWLSELLRSPRAEVAPVPDEMADFVRQTYDFLMVGHNSEAVQLLAEARKGKTHRETALEVLVRTGQLPANADPFLLVNGIHSGFSSAVLQAAAEIPAYVGGDDRVDYTQLDAFSIDDAETQEIDDALSVSLDNGDVIVGVHIADPAYFVDKGSAVDRAAEDRPLSLYLPTTTVMMFPEAVGCGVASLSVDGQRPALTFMVRFAPDGVLKDWQFCSAKIHVKHRLTYEEADEILADRENHPLSEALSRLDSIAGCLHQARAENGAFLLGRPEIKVRVTDDQVSVTRIDSNTPSHALVSELMILANRLTAEYALSNDIPVIYRIQDPPSDPVKSLDTYDPMSFQQEVRKLKRTRLSTHPEPHSGLGLDLYTQVSSPLRRYADLVLQRQLDAHFRGVPLPYEQQELLEVLGNVDRTMSQNRNLERDACRQWILEYLKREQMGEALEVTVVHKSQQHFFAELDDVLERGLLLGRRPFKLGERIQVRIKDIDPQKSRLVLEAL